MQDFTIGNLLIKRQKIVCIWRLVRKLRTRKTRFPESCACSLYLQGGLPIIYY